MRVLDTIKSWADRFRAQLMTLWFCRSHPRTPLAARILAALVLAYAFSPIDLIPDFIPVLGYLDDLLLVPLGITLALKMIPPAVMVECRAKARDAVQQAKPTNWIAAGVIIAVWLFLAVLGILLFINHY